MDNSESSNVELIYEYTETILSDINKSIDNIASKLIAVLGLSGVLMKFAADMPFEGVGFLIRGAILACLLSSVSICGAGLYPKSRGPVRLKPEYLLDDEIYRSSAEKIRLIIIRHQSDQFSELLKLQAFRVGCLNVGIGLIIAASILSALNAIVVSIQ